jgi:outer membrane protein OmpA-like peptidoglycan-associated protein
VLIAGHTDATGTPDHNLELSKRRADSVASYARTLGVEDKRIRIAGEGEAVPVASNDTTDGRQENRRVEIAIFANEDMKEEIAEKGGEG